MAIDAFATGAYLTAASATITAAPFSVYVLFKSSSFAASQTVWSFANSANTTDIFNANLTTGSVASFRISDAVGAVTITGTTVLSTNTWYAAVYVARSATDRELYIDAVSQGTSVTSRTPSGVNQIMVGIRGGSANANPATASTIARVAAWNIALTTADIALIGSATLRRSPAYVQIESLKNYWRLPVTTDVTDSLANNNLTLTGAPTNAVDPDFAERPYALTQHRSIDGNGIVTDEFAWQTDHTGAIDAWLYRPGFTPPEGVIDRVITTPGSFLAPTANYDVTLKDDVGNDVLAGLVGTRSATATEVAYLYDALSSAAHYGELATLGPMRLVIDAAGAFKTGKIAIITRRPKAA